VDHKHITAVVIVGYAAQTILHVLGAGSFQESQVVGMIDYAHAVCVLIIYFALEEPLVGAR